MTNQCFYFERTDGTYRLQSKNDGDLLLGADGDQVVGQQLAGRQELVVAALIDEDVELRAGVGGGQRGGVVRLKDEKSCDPHESGLKPVNASVHICVTSIMITGRHTGHSSRSVLKPVTS